MVYKWCVVPHCTNTTINSPNKVFVSVPTNPKRRKIWLELAGRDPNSILLSSNVFMCEDHLNMETDTKNYMMYKMGFCQKILLVDKAVPTKFHCQEDRKRRLSAVGSSRKVFHERQRTDLVPECLQSATETYAESLPKMDDMTQNIIDPEVENEDTLDAPESEAFNNVKQEIDEIADVRNEPILAENTPNEFYNEESKHFINQIIDEGGKVWCEENFLTTWNSHSVKTETIEDFNTGNDSTVRIFSQFGVKTELNEMKVEAVPEDSHFIRDKNHHLQNENTECSTTKMDDVSEMWSLKQQDLTLEKCDHLSRIDFIHSVKTETCEDIYETEGGSKSITNQVIHENRNNYSVKMEISDDFNSKTVCTKDKMEVQMKPSSPECDLPTNLDSMILKPKNHKCHLCDYSSSRNGHLQQHIKSVHLKLKNHKCTLCDYSSSRTGDFRMHMESVHLKIKNHECKFCDFSSSRNACLQKHIKAVHLNLKNHKCHLCNYSSTENSYLQQHLESVHLKIKHHKCDLCGYSSSRSSDLQKHLKSIHLKLRNHKCDLCDYSSSQKVHLQEHMKAVHLKLKNHECNLCDFSSSRKTDLQKHLKAVHLKIKNHKCRLCSYGTATKADLQKHLKSIHLKLKDHKCDLCDYSSSFKETLQQHMKSIHLKLKNHECNLCDYSSSRKGDLEKHLKSIHLKLKNYKCDLCDYCSSQKGGLQRHLKSIHSKLENRIEEKYIYYAINK